MKFNEILSRRRRELSISQEALAQRLDVSRQAVSKWETGDSQPELSNFLALCQILDIPPNQLSGCQDIPSSSMPEEKPKAADAEKNTPQPQLKRNISSAALLLTLCCFLAGLAIGLLFSWKSAALPFPGAASDGTTTGLNSAQIVDRLSISGFYIDDSTSSNTDTKKRLTLSFSPSISNQELTYSVIKSEGPYNQTVYPVQYENGICTCQIMVDLNTDFMLTAAVTDGTTTSTQSLIRIYDVTSNSYSWEEYWRQPPEN